MSKHFTRVSKADGSTRRKVFEIVNRVGRYSATAIARRQRRQQQRGGAN